MARAATAAAVLSGLPSTVHALTTGRDPLDAVRAAATLAPDPHPTPPPLRVLATGAVVHGVVSLGWACVLAAVLPRRHTVLWGAAAGAAIAALDLGVVARRIPDPAIRELAPVPQIADHVLFGAIVGWSFARAGRAARSA